MQVRELPNRLRKHLGSAMQKMSKSSLHMFVNTDLAPKSIALKEKVSKWEMFGSFHLRVGLIQISNNKSDLRLDIKYNTTVYKYLNQGSV